MTQSSAKLRPDRAFSRVVDLSVMAVGPFAAVDILERVLLAGQRLTTGSGNP